jgi:hypothetical protein
MVDRPVVDPFPEGIGIEDGSEEEDGLFRWVPIFEREAFGDVVSFGVGLGRFGW